MSLPSMISEGSSCTSAFMSYKILGYFIIFAHPETSGEITELFYIYLDFSVLYTSFCTDCTDLHDVYTELIPVTARWLKMYF